MLRAGTGAEPNVTRRTVAIGPLFIPVFTGSIILPGNGNYRDYLNAGIMAVTMNSTALGMGRRPAIDCHDRWTRR